MKFSCAICLSVLEDHFKYCPNCTSSIDLQCQACLFRFSKSHKCCVSCGSLVQSANQAAAASEQLDTVVNEQTTESSTSSKNAKEGSKKRAKINILKGQEMTPIKQDDGGGWRYVFLDKNDNYKETCAKIIYIYFQSK